MFPFTLSRKKEPVYGNTSQQRLYGFSGAAISDIGCTRANNEDNFVFGKNINYECADHCLINVAFSHFSNDWHVACVLDGMGGGEMGEVASSNTAKILLDNLSHIEHAQAKTEVDLILRKVFLEANNQILSLQKEYQILGTTATVLCTNGTEFKVYYLGDSRAYWMRGRELLQITKDQTLAQVKIDAGIYREGDPLTELDKHKLTDYIGRDKSREHLKPEESPWFPIQKGDKILLCSDGLTNMCPNDVLSRILYENASASEAASRMVSTAKANGGTDNITCVVIHFS